MCRCKHGASRLGCRHATEGGAHADEHPCFRNSTQLLCERVGGVELDHVDGCIGPQKLQKGVFVDDSPVRTLSLERDNLHKRVPLSQGTH